MRRHAWLLSPLLERGEFELPVPICEQSDDSIRLSFATSRRAFTTDMKSLQIEVCNRLIDWRRRKCPGGPRLSWFDRLLWVSLYTYVRGIARILSPSYHNLSHGSRTLAIYSTQFSVDGPRQGTYNLRSLGIPVDGCRLMPMHVVSVGSVLMLGIVRLFAMVAEMGFAVVMPRRHPSIVVVMDVRVISSTVTMVNRAYGSKRKLLLSAAIARRDRSIRAAAITSSPAIGRYVASEHCGFSRLQHGSRARATRGCQPLRHVNLAFRAAKDSRSKQARERLDACRETSDVCVCPEKGAGQT